MLREEFGIIASIKWPNDVLINGRKAAGILTETQSDQDFSRFIVMGIGVNVNHSREEMAGPFRYPATSIAIEAGFASQKAEGSLAVPEPFRTGLRPISSKKGSLP